MSDIKGNIESRTLNRYGKHVMQLYRALNRQYDKEGAISVIGNLIYKNFGYRSAYFDAIEDNEMIIIKNLSYQHVGSNYDAANNLAPEVFNFKIPINGYKGVIYLEDRDSIEKMFPCLDKIASPNILLSIPVFSQNRLIGIFIVYDIYTRKMSPEFKNLMQLAAKEFTAVFSRIEKHSLAFENILGLTTLGNILLYSLEERQTNFSNPLQKIASMLPNVTGMKECILALADENEEFLLTYCSNLDMNAVIEKEKCLSNRFKIEDNMIVTELKTRKSVVVHDALSDPKCDKGLAKRLGIYSAIFLPILNIRNEPLGMLCLHNGKYETFSKRQIHFLEIITDHIGLTISNMDYIGDLRIWSKYDGLTELLNRRTFEDIYEELYNIYRPSERKFSILMLDIDDFKSINDVYGHQVGDRVLKNLARCVKKNVREKDVVARYGGEEIIIILKDLDKNEAKVIANRIRRMISILSVDGISVTVSIGISTFGVDSYDKENLIYIADKCLYEAKSIGKNQVVST